MTRNEANSVISPEKRAANRRTALVLVLIMLAVFVGFLLKKMLFP